MKTLRKFPSDCSQCGITSRNGWSTEEKTPHDDVTIDDIPSSTIDMESTNDDELKVTYVNDAFVTDIEIDDAKPDSGQSEESRPPSDEKSHNALSRTLDIVTRLKDRTSLWTKLHRKHIRWSLRISLLLLYNIYLGFAIYFSWSATVSWCEGVRFLIIITAFAYYCAFYSYVFKPFLQRPCIRALSPIAKTSVKLTSHQHFGKFLWITVWAAVLVFLLLDTRDDRNRLVSAAGLLVLLLLGFIFSAHPRKVVWRHILWGMIIQFVLGLLILRWSVGKMVFQCLGDKVKTFLDYTDKGSGFVFGYLITGELTGAPVQAAIFAFKVMCVVIFFSFIVSILYYYGVMQILVIKVGWLLQVTIGTTACESMNAAGNIFLGMTESPLLIRPYLPLMTKSELHAVLTGGFATIAGSVLAAYINFGVNASHLLSASVMSAPAALAYSKLVYPETEQSLTQAEDLKIEKAKEVNALEAATNGASIAIALVANIAANLVAFVAFIALLDGTLAWFGSLIELDFISFEWLLSKLFIPLSVIMGVDWQDSERVAHLVGLKTVVNEFVAYKKLAQFQEESLLSPRSEAIATFALCGFSNISSIGIQIGALGAMAPERRRDLASLAVRAMIAGSAACFMTACVAGTLLTDDIQLANRTNRSLS